MTAHADPSTADLRTADGFSMSLWRRRSPLPRELAGWLTRTEQDRAERYRSAARQGSFVSGRYLAKRCLLRDSRFQPASDAPNVPAEIEILPDEAGGHGAPVVRRGGRLQPWSLSISHTPRWTAVAACLHTQLRVGLDLVEMESGIRLNDLWFSPDEQRIIRAATLPEQARLLLWSIKEALYKTLEPPARFVPRDWETRIADDDGGLRFRYRQRPYVAQVRLLRIPHTLLLAVAAVQTGNTDRDGPNDSTLRSLPRDGQAPERLHAGREFVTDGFAD